MKRIADIYKFMIRKISIQNYKSLKDITLELDNLAVIFGPNSAGKSNLFDAIHLLSRLVTEKNLKEAFKDHRGNLVEALYYEENLKSLFKKEKHIISFSAEVELSDQVVEDIESQIRSLRRGVDAIERHPDNKAIITNRFLKYEVGLQILPRSGQVQVINERLSALRKDGKGEKSRNAFIEKTNGKLSLRMEGQAHPTFHEIGLDYTIVSTPLYAPHYPHLSAFREEMSRCHFYYFEPRELMRSGDSIAQITNLGPKGEYLAAFYHTLKQNNPRQFKDLTLAAKSLLPNLENLEVELTEKGELYLQIVEKSGSFSNRLISEGTLRVLGLLAVLCPTCKSTTIGYEEPENGVHPRRLETMADLFKNSTSSNRQILINTHSPILPRYFSDKQLIVCKKEGNLTEFVPFSSAGVLYRDREIDEFLTEYIVRGDFGG